MRFRSDIPQKAASYLTRLEKQVDAAVLRAMTTTGIRGEAKAKAAIEQEAYDTGDLLRSVTHEIIRRNDRLVLSVFASAEHGIFVEKGRKPGSFPNLNALTKWAGRKLREEGVNTRVNVTFEQLKALAATSSGSQKDAYRTHLSMLFLVGKKIATKGIRGKLIFRKLERELIGFFRAELQKELNSLR